MVQQIPLHFENCTPNNCLSTVNYITFKVFDRVDNCCYICIENEPNSLCYFTVNNPTRKNINFLAIDKCTLTGDRDKKCDCAIFDSNSFYFIEMKTSTPAHRRKRKSDAYEQLKNTISIFKERIIFDNYELFALISFGQTYCIPKTDSSHMARRKELSDLYKAKLIEGNLIKFEG